MKRYLFLMTIMLIALACGNVFGPFGDETDSAPLEEPKRPIAEILEFEKEIPRNGYNPRNCVKGLVPFPRVRFKLSERCRVAMRIARSSTVKNDDGEYDNATIWDVDLDTLPAGWNDTAIVWNGLDDNGEVVNGRLVLYVQTYLRWSGGDRAVDEYLFLDYSPPAVLYAGDIRNTNQTSSENPFGLSIPLTETSHAWMYVLNSTGDTVGEVADSLTAEDIASKSQWIHFDWTPTGLDSCENFRVRVSLMDPAGNVAEIDVNKITGRAYRNSSGGFSKVGFFKTRDVISPTSEKHSEHASKIGMNILEGYCDSITGGGTPTDVRIEIYTNADFSGDPVYADTIGTTVPVSIDWFGSGRSSDYEDYYVLITAESSTGYSVSSKDDPIFDPKITVN